MGDIRYNPLPANAPKPTQAPQGGLARLVNALGLNDPTQTIMPNVTPLGVTAFLKNGVPDVAARSAATSSMLDSLHEIMSNLGIPDLASKIAARYPRVSAHVSQLSATPLPSTDPARQFLGANMAAAHPKMSEIFINPKLAAKDRSGKDAANTITHELTHAAQRIGLGDGLDDLYARLQKHVGYDANPLEISANAAAARRVK